MSVDVDHVRERLHGWAHSEAAARAIHAATVAGMQHQFREIERTHQRWSSLEAQDRDLYAYMASAFMEAAVRSLEEDD